MFRLVGCDTAAVRVTCIVALAYAIGAIEDRADKGNLMYQSELISFILRSPLHGAFDRGAHDPVGCVRCRNLGTRELTGTVPTELGLYTALTVL